MIDYVVCTLNQIRTTIGVSEGVFSGFKEDYGSDTIISWESRKKLPRSIFRDEPVLLLCFSDSQNSRNMFGSD
jgi:hypothetical protein